MPPPTGRARRGQRLDLALELHPALDGDVFERRGEQRLAGREVVLGSPA
jgi:hypothetical protein